MKDEVLQKVLSEDTTVIPRYDVVTPDGTIVAENVQLILKNQVLTEGTPLNKQSLLEDATAAALGLDATAATPNDALWTIRSSAGYCPRLIIRSAPGATIYVQRVPEDTNATSYTVSSTGVLTIDLMFYGTYKIWGRIDGTLTTTKYLDVFTNERYNMNVFNYVTYAKLTVDDEIGSTVQAIHTDGSTVTGVIGADKTCTLPFYKTGNWRCNGVYDTYNSGFRTLIATEATKGNTIEQALAWTKIRVNVTSGSIVTATRNNLDKSGESVNGVCTLWLPETGAWSIKATLNDKTATVTSYPTLHETTVVNLSYA